MLEPASDVLGLVGSRDREPGGAAVEGGAGAAVRTVAVSIRLDDRAEL
jgi:hypothetical protein